MNTTFKLLLAAGVAMSMASCATIVSGSTQVVGVTTVDAAGKSITGAECELTNDKGAWLIKTPGSASIGRSAENLQIICTKDGLTGTASDESSTKDMAYGNVIFGGLIGAGVDIQSGAAFDYTPNIQVILQ